MGPWQGLAGKFGFPAQKMIDIRPQAEPPENQSDNRHAEKHFQNIGRGKPLQSKHCADCQRKGACHALGEASRGRRRSEADGAGPGAQREIVEGIEGVEARQQRISPENRPEAEENGRRLKDDADENHQTDHPRLKEERLEPLVSVLRPGFLEALLKDEISLWIMHGLFLSEPNRSLLEGASSLRHPLSLLAYESTPAGGSSGSLMESLRHAARFAIGE